jgi:hypothetical protein
MSDPTVHERIAVALETIASAFAVHETKTCRLLSMDRIAVLENTTAQKPIGWYWRLTFLDAVEARIFDVDLHMVHPTSEHEAARGRMLLAALGKAVGICKGDTAEIVGKFFQLAYAGGRLVGIARTPDELCMEARKLPPVDEIDFHPPFDGLTEAQESPFLP